MDKESVLAQLETDKPVVRFISYSNEGNCTPERGVSPKKKMVIIGIGGRVKFR